MLAVAVTTVAVCGLGVSSAQAQWTVTILDPAGSTQSFGWACGGSQQVGQTVVGGVTSASLWSGTAASWVDLSPAGATFSAARGATGSQQVGQATVDGVSHAGLWNGTAASWVDLNPAGATSSNANGVSGPLQGGWASVGGVTRASLWSGTAASWVDLTPATVTSSTVNGISGSQQVGSFLTNNLVPFAHACLWSGTAASFVDLHPAAASNSQPGGGSNSVALATDGTQQGGWAGVGSLARAASLWSGTADSWVNLNPAGSVESVVNAMGDGLQVGFASFRGDPHAVLWNGTAASFEDLDAYLPAGQFLQSRAQGISSDGVNLYITGWAVPHGPFNTSAVVWSRPLPTPGAAALLGLGGVFASRRRR
jgi:hypothetical protein